MGDLNRSVEIIRGDAGDGTVSGIIASDGEAADGNIINVEGVRGLESGVPLLFEHGFVDGVRELGSWRSFSTDNRSKPGQRTIRGVAQIETGGDGDRAEARRDIAYMVQQGHLRQLSVRLTPEGSPVARTALPSDHFAYVDADNTGLDQARRWGMYMERSKLHEVSVVAMGADERAILGRSVETDGVLRSLWQDVSMRLAEADYNFDPEGKYVVVRLMDGSEHRVDVRVYEKLCGDSIKYLRRGFDLVSADYPVVRAEQAEVEQEVPAPPVEPAMPEGEPTPEDLSNVEELIERRLAAIPDTVDRMVEQTLMRFKGKI